MQKLIGDNFDSPTVLEDFLDGSGVKNMPAMQEMQETWVRFLGHEDALEEEMVTGSSILAWRIPWTEEPGRLQSMGSQESDMTEHSLEEANTISELTPVSMVPSMFRKRWPFPTGSVLCQGVSHFFLSNRCPWGVHRLSIVCLWPRVFHRCL